MVREGRKDEAVKSLSPHHRKEREREREQGVAAWREYVVMQRNRIFQFWLNMNVHHLKFTERSAKHKHLVKVWHITEHLAH